MPYAVLQDGILLLANDRFLQALGFSSDSEVETPNLLDMSVGLDKDEFRYFLKHAARTDKGDLHPPSIKVSFKAHNGAVVEADVYGWRQRLGDDYVIEIKLVTKEDKTLKNKVKHLPWKLYLCFFCLALLTLLPNTLLPKLNVNNAPATFLPPDSPSMILNDEVRQMFPDDEVVILLFEGVALFSDGFLLAYEDLASSLEDLEQVSDVIAITRQDHISGSDEGFTVSPLLDVDYLEESHPSERKESALSDRFARNTLVAADGSAIALIVIPESLDNSILNLALEEEILATTKAHQLDGYLAALSGEISIDVAQMRMVLRDNMIFIPITVVIGLILTWILFRRVIAVVTTGVVIGAVVNSTIVFYVLFDQPFNTIAGILPPLLSALTIAVLVHFYNALYYASRRGLVGKPRVQMALNEIKKPALFSTLTTSVGLASLGLSPIPPISMFGMTAAVGVLLIYLIVIHILPPIYAHFDHQPWPDRKFGLQYMDHFVAVMYRVGIRKPLWVIGITLVLLGASIPSLMRVGVETNLLEFFPDDHPLRTSNDLIEKKLVGTMPLEVVFTSELESGLIQSENLKQVKAFQQALSEHPFVDKTLSIADFVEEMHWGFHGEDPNYRAIPEDSTLITQYLFIYDGEDLYDFIDESYQVARVTINANVHGANDISQLMDDIRQALSQLPNPNGLEWKVTGAARMFADQEDLLIEGQVKSLSGALALIFILMLLSWRSIKDAALCMIPNLSPVLSIFIVMGVVGIHLDLATAMIASVAVGIAVDDTIHVYHGFIHRLNQGHSAVLALVRTYQQAGRAVMTTTIILCAQFLLLLASAFVPMGHFGALASTGLVAALVFDLVLLPAILIVIFHRPRKKITS
ncbi:MAG: efflux RND transporter permease subunit [Cellvibrionaceae bacterium]